MLKTIIGKLGGGDLKLERFKRFFFFFPSFKLKKLTQNPKTELKRLWIGLNSGTK